MKSIRPYYGELTVEARHRILRAARLRVQLTNVALAARFNVSEYSVQSFIRRARQKRAI